MTPVFEDRADAGRQLARALDDYRDSEAVVVGLPRGGVAVAFQIAVLLHLRLRVLIVRKLGAPANPELAIGAVSETGERWLDERIIPHVNADRAYIEAEIERQMAEAGRRQAQYALRLALDIVRDRTTVVVDDGIATGSTAFVALRSVRKLGARSVVLATPVASRQAVEMLSPSADRSVVLLTPEPFLAVGYHYERFDQVTDEEVVEYLRSANDSIDASRL